MQNIMFSIILLGSTSLAFGLGFIPSTGNFNLGIRIKQQNRHHHHHGRGRKRQRHNKRPFLLSSRSKDNEFDVQSLLVNIDDRPSIKSLISSSAEGEEQVSSSTPSTHHHHCQQQEQQSLCCVQRRQFIAASVILATAIASEANAAVIPTSTNRKLTEKVNYQDSPINKRSGISLSEPERIYPLSFITYLSRFLLVFDDECQQWWYTQAQAIPSKSTKEEVESIRLKQFGQFAASVEVGLIDFEGNDGVKTLSDSLVKRYGPSSLDTVDVITERYLGSNMTTSSQGIEGDFNSLVKAGSANSTSTSSTTSPTSSSTTRAKAAAAVAAKISEREARKSKEALRQIALLFSLMTKYQPVDEITQILAADDDAAIERIEIIDGGSGYMPPEHGIPNIKFPDPPTMGCPDFGASVAKGQAVMRETGRVLNIELIDGGKGYTTPPSIEISYPDGESLQAIANAVLGKKKQKGSVVNFELIDKGMGYSSLNDISVTISPPEDDGGVTASAKAILEYEVADIEIIDKGRGYAAERAINIEIDPPQTLGSSGSRSAFAISYPKGTYTSYESFIGPDSDSAVRASLSSVDTSQWIAGPTSSQLLALLPSGFGVQYNDALERYILSRSSTANNWDDILAGNLEGQQFKPINPIFGLRGRSPIEQERKLDVSKVLRFMASGAVCSSIAHFSLTPIDVVKTKVQTQPDVYDKGIIGTFKQVLEDEGAATFFDGWEPTFVGFFFSGALGFFATEFFRRYYSSLLVSVLTVPEVNAATVVSSLEIPLIVASAATSGFICCFLLAPFDAVRIRTVSQPDFADNIFGVVGRMVKEEGLLSLFSAVPVWWVKEVPFNVFKFLVFDTSTEFLYDTFPVAREDIRLSLLVSLVGGTLGGIAATIVSHPADVVVSELKKSKTDMTAWEAVEILKDRSGLGAFATGIRLRMIFYSLLVSLQFLLYDSVRIVLGVGTDDMKLYLNVLNVALNEKINQ